MFPYLKKNFIRPQIINLGLVPFALAEFEMHFAHEEVCSGSNDCVIVFEPSDIAYCLGRSSMSYHDIKQNNTKALDKKYYILDRGGRTTVHSKNQFVAYFVIDILHSSISIDKFIYILEQIMIDYLFDNFKITAERLDINRGCFVGKKKIGFLGIRVKKGVTMYGIAINICNDLSLFDEIIPCGLKNVEITSVAHVKQQEFDENKSKILFDNFVNFLRVNVARYFCES